MYIIYVTYSIPGNYRFLFPPGTAAAPPAQPVKATTLGQWSHLCPQQETFGPPKLSSIYILVPPTFSFSSSGTILVICTAQQTNVK